MAYNWAPLLGRFGLVDETLVFKGGQTELDGRVIREVGNFISDQTFGGGTISADVEFLGKSDVEACEFILAYEPALQAFISAGLGGLGHLLGVRQWGNVPSPEAPPWHKYGGIGSRDTLEAKRPYHLSVTAIGSRISVSLDGVDALAVNLPRVLPRGQAGLWCMGTHDINVSNFKIERKEPRAFVIMQFTTPYDQLYKEVIVPLCTELGLSAIRADETYGPGVIIVDIERGIAESNVIIAEITPCNPNVYYEVGYGRAIGKPTILIAEKSTQLPFDLSPFRVLFYENTIAGKRRVEDGLRKHLQALQVDW